MGAGSGVPLPKESQESWGSLGFGGGVKKGGSGFERMGRGWCGELRDWKKFEIFRSSKR